LHILTAVVAIGGTLLAVASSLADELQRDGLALAERMCAQCHAIGPIGASAVSAKNALRRGLVVDELPEGSALQILGIFLNAA
jgi:mono/diheme cytochrome c family protein